MDKNTRALADVAELFKGCGDMTRAGIICQLSGGEKCVCELASQLGMTSSAISHQLRILKHTRIVRSRRSGRSVLYVLDDRRIQQIFDLAFAHVREEQENEMV